MKLYSFYTLKAMWDGQGKIKMYYGMSRVKKQLSGKSSIVSMLFSLLFYDYWEYQNYVKKTKHLTKS